MDRLEIYTCMYYFIKQTLGGVFYTGKIIVNSSKRYLSYPAQIYEREGDAGRNI